MSTNPKDATRTLPDRPNPRHLKDQARDLLKAGEAESLSDAQFKIARFYGFASWPKLKGSRRFTERGRRTQTSHRHQRRRSRQNSYDPQPGAAPCAVRLLAFPGSGNGVDVCRG
jgi:hypothetical protein